MESIIYVNNDNNVDSYLVDIDMLKIKDLRNRIDEWCGKGNLIIKECPFLEIDENKKREIISKKEIGYIKDKWALYKQVLYEFKYYEYIPHQLSLLCDNFLEIENKNLPLEFSSHLRKVLNYKYTNQDEEYYFEEFLNCFDFIKINLEEVVKSDIDLRKKITLLNKIKFLLTNTKIPKSEFLPKSYMDLINERLKNRELIISNGIFHTFMYTKEQRNDRRIRALNALPKNEDLKKYKLIK